MDHMHHGGKDYLLGVDRVSGFILCNEVKGTGAGEVVRSLEEVAAIAGLPLVIRMDGGKGLNNEKVQNWAEKYKINLNVFY